MGEEEGILVGMEMSSLWVKEKGETRSSLSICSSVLSDSTHYHSQWNHCPLAVHLGHMKIIDSYVAWK